jgi:hypothetical protein
LRQTTQQKVCIITTRFNGYINALNRKEYR